MKTIATKLEERPEKLFSGYPKIRKSLPEDYQRIYEKHYADNRNGQTAASFFSSKLEQWMHKKIAADTRQNSRLATLEIGAGTLNQLQYEPTEIYDIVEPLYIDRVEESKGIWRIDIVYVDNPLAFQYVQSQKWQGGYIL